MQAVATQPPETTASGSLFCSVYDHMGRRFQKVVGSATNTFVYDGWNLIQETSASATNRYTWGLDLSGSLQGAGGVGGLLAVTTADGTYLPAFDGNGNVGQYIDATNGTVVAHREYSPFGETITSTGSKKDDFAHWFSTKYLDPETGLSYYGYRYYDAEKGRWTSTDPIEESDSVNLYLFCRNSLDSDLLGLARVRLPQCQTCEEDPCNVCGKNITRLLARTRNETVSQFRLLRRRKKVQICRALVNIFNRSGRASTWDIRELAHRKRFFVSKTCGTAQCGLCTMQEGRHTAVLGTVTVGDKCYEPGEVNYLLWGLINKECYSVRGRPTIVIPVVPPFPPVVIPGRHTLLHASSLVIGYRIRERGGTNIPGRLAWTRAGYNGSMPGYRDSRIENCTSCEQEEYLGPFSVHLGQPGSGNTFDISVSVP